METVEFRGIQFKVSVGVLEKKGVQNHPSLVGESVRLEDVHSEGGEHAGNLGEQRGPVRRQHHQGIPSALLYKINFHPPARQVAGQPEVLEDLLIRVGTEIVPREAFQKILERLGVRLSP